MRFLRRNSKVTVERYRSQGQWRFRTRHVNGNILTQSGESYWNLSEANRAIAGAHPGLPVVETDS